MRVNAAAAACRALPFKVPMPILNMLCLVSASMVSNSTAPRKWAKASRDGLGLLYPLRSQADSGREAGLYGLSAVIGRT